MTGPGNARPPRWRTALIAIAAVVLAASLAVLGAVQLGYSQGREEYGRLAAHADVRTAEGGGLAGMGADWDALRAANPDVVAWVSIPGTDVDYPVAQGPDNDYYLTRDFSGETGWAAQCGSVFLDWRNDAGFGDPACFLYGHNMADGSMFADVAAMADQARFDAAREAYLLTPAGNFKLRTFSLVHCAADDPIVQTSFASPDEMAAYVRDKAARSVVDPGDAPEPCSIGKVVALATCDNDAGGRYVLFAYVEDELPRSAESGGSRVPADAALDH